MGWLAAQGAIMAIGLFIGLVCSVIGLFFGHIILFDSIALGIAAGVCCNQVTAIHSALCLVIGIATFLLLLWLQNTSIGFWLVGGLLTLIYAAVFGLLAYFISEHDPIWGWVIFGLVFLVGHLPGAGFHCGRCHAFPGSASLAGRIHRPAFRHSGKQRRQPQTAAGCAAQS